MEKRNLGYTGPPNHHLAKMLFEDWKDREEFTISGNVNPIFQMLQTQLLSSIKIIKPKSGHAQDQILQMEFYESLVEGEMWKVLREIQRRGIPTNSGLMTPTISPSSTAYPPYVTAIMGYTEGKTCNGIGIINGMRTHLRDKMTETVRNWLRMKKKENQENRYG